MSEVKDSIRFDDADTISIYFNETSSAILTTNAVYRDPAAWYHIVVAVDTTQATAANGQPAKVLAQCDCCHP